MLLRTILRLALGIGLLLAGTAHAMPPTLWPQSDSRNLSMHSLLPVAVIYFTGGKADSAHNEMVRSIIRQSKSGLGLTVYEHVLDSERALASTIERIAEEKIGLIVIVKPRDRDALMRIPGLYPDIRFSVIDVPEPLYLVNVHSMHFHEASGAYMIGALAAMQSGTGSIGFISRRDDDDMRNLAYAFFQGAKYIDPDIEVVRQLEARTSRGRLSPPPGNADIMFVLDEALFDASLRTAHESKRLVIPFDHDLTSEHPGFVLTSLLKHYDLALYETLRRYRHGDWQPGSHILGAGEGYIDYVLAAGNRNLLSKKTIDRMEHIKDLMAQGLLEVVPLGQ